MPQKICDGCLQQVQVACKIKLKCIVADQKLRAALKAEEQQTIELESRKQLIEETEGFIIEQEKVLQNEEAIEQTIHQQNNVKADATIGTKEGNSQLSDRTCAFCQEEFKKVKLKAEHLKAAHLNELTCHICNKRRTSVIATERCIRSHQSGNSFLCQFCALTFHFRSVLLAHIEKVHVARSFACDLCGKMIKHKISLIRHMRTRHTTNRFLCTHGCIEKSYSTMNSLRLHLYRRHDFPAPLHCQVCKAGFSNAAEIKAHNKSRGGCGSNRDLLLKPKRTVLLSEYCKIFDGAFHCKFCTKIYPAKKKAYDHYNNYHMDNKTCKICEKTFANNSNYRFHYESVHEAEKRTKCGFPGCRKNYKSDVKLEEHRKTHEGQEISLRRKRKN